MMLHNMLLLVISLAVFNGAVYGAERPVAELLAEFDSAKTGQEILASIATLKQLGPDATGVLESYALDSSKEARRRIVAYRLVLKRRPPVAAVAALRERLQSDPNMDFRALCAEEMGKWPSSETKAILKTLLTDPKENGEVQLAAAAGLAHMGDDSGKERAVKAIIQDEPGAASATRTLEKLRANDVVTRIDHAARGPGSTRIRGTAEEASLRIRLAGKTGAEEMSILDTAIRDKESREVRKWAALRLVQIGSPEAGQRLAVVAKSSDTSVAATALRGLRVGLERKIWTAEQFSAWMR